MSGATITRMRISTNRFLTIKQILPCRGTKICDKQLHTGLMFRQCFQHTSDSFNQIHRQRQQLQIVPCLSPVLRDPVVKSYHALSCGRNSEPKLGFQTRHKSTKDGEGLPEIQEEDLQETFTHGWGPGGQSVNKTTNCCVLRHVPTGVFVKVHETRSLPENRKIARLRLRQKLDWFYNGEDSQLEKEKRINSVRKRAKKKKTNERLEKLKAFKEREGLT